jgi:hypothetical protein
MERTRPVDLQAIRDRNVYDAGMEAGSTNARLDALDAKFDVFEEKISELGRSIERIDKRLDALHRILITAAVGVPAAYAVLSRLIS